MQYSLTYFLENGVSFTYAPDNPGVPQVQGPMDNLALRAQFHEAVDARRGLSPQRKQHAGECNENGKKESGSFCTLCRHLSGICFLCGSTGLKSGELDCALCRLAKVREMREKDVAL
jgi:hypothetical protein